MPHRDKKKYNEYMNNYMKRRYKQRRELGFQVLGDKCCKCGSKDQLEFDHIDRDTKVNSISKLWSMSEKKFLEELAKCQVLCNSCHLEKSRECGDFNRKISGTGSGSEESSPQ